MSPHLCRAYQALKSHKDWMTALDVATHADISPRTARAHLLMLVKGGAVERSTTFPKHHYRAIPINPTNQLLLENIETACVIMRI